MVVHSRLVCGKNGGFATLGFAVIRSSPQRLPSAGLSCEGRAASGCWTPRQVALMLSIHTLGTLLLAAFHDSGGEQNDDQDNNADDHESFHDPTGHRVTLEGVRAARQVLQLIVGQGCHSRTQPLDVNTVSERSLRGEATGK
jgi:hypothetical protein